MKALLQVHWPSLATLLAIFMLISYEMVIEPYYIKHTPYEVHKIQPYAVDPASCMLDLNGHVIIDSCSKKELFLPGDEFSMVYRVEVTRECDAKYEPWMEGPIRFGPSMLEGVHLGHQLPPASGHFLSMVRKIPASAVPGKYFFKVKTVACEGQRVEWSPPTELIVTRRDAREVRQ